jgi:bifunctional non-homologous end joining protein LigD
VQNVATLLYYGNLGAIEFHATLAKLRETNATALSFDLDPSTKDFERVREVALHLNEVLKQLSINSVAKTSGATGLQVFVPLDETIPFTETRAFVTFIAKYMEQRWPKLISTARLVRERGDCVYIDAPQHGHTRTLIAAYSVRATVAATVSTPITWEELNQGCVPRDFTIRNVPDRVQQLGDLMDSAPVSPASVIRHVLSELK